MTGEPILVVDDNPVNLKLLRMILMHVQRLEADPMNGDAYVAKPIDLHALLALVAGRLRP